MSRTSIPTSKGSVTVLSSLRVKGTLSLHIRLYTVIVNWIRFIPIHHDPSVNTKLSAVGRLKAIVQKMKLTVAPCIFCRITKMY